MRQQAQAEDLVEHAYAWARLVARGRRRQGCMAGACNLCRPQALEARLVTRPRRAPHLVILSRKTRRCSFWMTRESCGTASGAGSTDDVRSMCAVEPRAGAARGGPSTGGPPSAGMHTVLCCAAAAAQLTCRRIFLMSPTTALTRGKSCAWGQVARRRSIGGGSVLCQRMSARAHWQMQIKSCAHRGRALTGHGSWPRCATAGGRAASKAEGACPAPVATPRRPQDACSTSASITPHLYPQADEVVEAPLPLLASDVQHHVTREHCAGGRGRAGKQSRQPKRGCCCASHDMSLACVAQACALSRARTPRPISRRHPPELGMLKISRSKDRMVVRYQPTSTTMPSTTCARFQGVWLQYLQHLRHSKLYRHSCQLASMPSDNCINLE